MKARSIIYIIDGFNFSYGVIQGTGHKWLDLEKYFLRLRQDDLIQHIHYFTSPVTGVTERANQQAYLNALNTLTSVTVTRGNHKRKTGRCLVRACTYAGEREFTALEEKRTDVQIALQMLEDAYENRAERFVLVSGDSDLVPAVNRVKGRGKEVVVYIPARDLKRGAAVELRSAATRHATLPTTLLGHAHFPDEMPDGAGGVIHKPAGW